MSSCSGHIGTTTRSGDPIVPRVLAGGCPGEGSVTQIDDTDFRLGPSEQSMTFRWKSSRGAHRSYGAIRIRLDHVAQSHRWTQPTRIRFGPGARPRLAGPARAFSHQVPGPKWSASWPSDRRTGRGPWSTRFENMRRPISRTPLGWWRWRESNPRPRATVWVFYGRSRRSDLASRLPPAEDLSASPSTVSGDGRQAMPTP